MYFKALPPGLEHEVRLSDRLAAWFPGEVLPILAVEPERGWMLMPDGGPILRDTPAMNTNETWLALLRSNAGIQLGCIERVPELLALGVPDRRLAQVPALFDRVLALAEETAASLPDSFASADIERLASLRAPLLRRAEQLAAIGLPETLQHDDLHDFNVFVGERGPLIFDWGDASISHPFYSLRVPLQCIAAGRALRYEDDPPELAPFRDAYLERWLAFAPMRVLLEAVSLVQPIAIMLRALTWHLAVSTASEEERTKDVDFVVELLKDFLATMQH